MQSAVPRHFTAYGLTILLYVGGIALLYSFQMQKPMKIETLSTPKTHKIEMTLSTFIPEVIPLPMVVKKIEMPKKVLVKKVIIKKLKPKPKVIKKVVSKKVSKPKGKVSSKIKKKQEKNQKPQASLAKKKHFLENVRLKIDKNKYYPRIARKKGIEGIVEVRFRILSNGNVSHISVSGPKVFYTSAKEAVKNAFPISIKNMPLSLVGDYVTIPLKYTIR